MQQRTNTAQTKPYGHGFDHVVQQADIRAFTNWWNARSHFPVSAADTAAPEEPDYAQAA